MKFQNRVFFAFLATMFVSAHTVESESAIVDKPKSGRELTSCPSIPHFKECYLKDYFLTFKSSDKVCSTIHGVDIHVKTVTGGKEFFYKSDYGAHGKKCEVRTTPYTERSNLVICFC
jgi:hypothetical protein